MLHVYEEIGINVTFETILFLYEY